MYGARSIIIRLYQTGHKKHLIFFTYPNYPSNIPVITFTVTQISKTSWNINISVNSLLFFLDKRTVDL